MTSLTVFIAITFSVLVISRKNNGTGLGLIVMSMLVWPEYLRVPLGLAEMSVPRVVGLVLIAKIYLSGQHRRVPSCIVDKLILFVWLYSLFASMVSDASTAQLIQMIGRFFDTILMYFIARWSLQSEDDIKALYVPLAITAIVMGGIGCYETVTTYSPYSQMISYRAWSWINKPPEFRYGFLRAQASTSVPIYFGMAMMLIVGMLWSLKVYVKNKFFHFLAVLCAVLGTLSSMSSGPWIGCFMLFALGAYQKNIKYIKPSLYLLLFFAVFVEVASNRHFYNMIDYIALNSQTAWYRTRLIEIAVGHLHEFWLLGFGSDWPHHWAAELDGRKHIDVVNHFLIVALSGGLPAMLGYILSHCFAVKMAIKSWKKSTEYSQKKLIFIITATLVALDLSSLSVGLYGPPLLISFVLLGIVVSCSRIVKA